VNANLLGQAAPGFDQPLGCCKPVMAARRDVPHKGTPTFYGLTPVKDRMPHKGTPIRYGLKPVRNRMPYTR